MRLLNCKTLKLQRFHQPEVPHYVILSHRWGSEELTFEDITRNPISDLNSSAQGKMGFSKVKGACKLAESYRYDWIWIDSCCIDKSSSADLQEDINSMWNYYANSNICYVYMADVPDSEAGWGVGFQNSDWFTRGWTLQELIAPVYVEFYARDWSPIGTKLERHEEIAEITTINGDLLTGDKSIDIFSAAERLSWAAHRQVTKEEDEAYSLLGVFQIHMSMLYGEGRERAFMRLQEAIYRSTTDHSLFLFRYSVHDDDQPLLADCPTRFCQRAHCESWKHRGTQCFPFEIPYSNVIASNFWEIQPHEQIITTVTPFRNEMSAPLSLLEYRDVSSRLIFFDENEGPIGVSHVAVLNHTREHHMEGAFCLLLLQPPDSKGTSFYRIRSFPALLPNIGEFTSRMRRKKILIAPGPAHAEREDYVDTCFAVPGDSLLVRSWKARRVVLQVQESPNTGLQKTFKIRTKQKDSKGQAEVSCRIAHGQNKSPQIFVRLEKIDEVWSIKEVSEVKFRGRQRKQHTLFLSKTLSDRCLICLSGGKQLYVGIRRSAASSCPGDRSIPQLRYEIFIRPVEEGRRRTLSRTDRGGLHVGNL